MVEATGSHLSLRASISLENWGGRDADPWTAFILAEATLSFVGFGFAVLPPVIEQSNAFVKELPDYLADLRGN